MGMGLSWSAEREKIREELGDELSENIRALLHYVESFDKHLYGILKDTEPPKELIEAYAFFTKLQDDVVVKNDVFDQQVQSYIRLFERLLALFKTEPRIIEDVVHAKKRAKAEGAPTIILKEKK